MTLPCPERTLLPFSWLSLQLLNSPPPTSRMKPGPKPGRKLLSPEASAERIERRRVKRAGYMRALRARKKARNSAVDAGLKL